MCGAGQADKPRAPSVGPSLSQGSIEKLLEGQMMERGWRCQLVPGPHSWGGGGSWGRWGRVGRTYSRASEARSGLEELQGAAQPDRMQV